MTKNKTKMRGENKMINKETLDALVKQVRDTEVMLERHKNDTIDTLINNTINVIELFERILEFRKATIPSEERRAREVQYNILLTELQGMFMLYLHNEDYCPRIDFEAMKNFVAGFKFAKRGENTK